MKVLIGCEFSGVVRRAFREKGHDAWSCDLLPAEDNSQYHIQKDILTIINEQWDMAIFHTPCTYLCNSGVRWLHTRPERWELMRQDALLFKKCMDASIPMKAMENPIPHKYALEIIGRKYDQIIQPWMFGHGETKATCLWLLGLNKLKPTNEVVGREQRLWKLPPSETRSKERSRTYLGIGNAFAQQWG